MKEHNWEKETVTVRAVYPGTPSLCFWKCKICGSSGGPVKEGSDKPDWDPFLAGTTLIDLSPDCEIAKKLITEYWEKYPASEVFDNSKHVFPAEPT